MNPWRCSRNLLALLFASSAAQGDWLENDDECQDGSCAFQALQLTGAKRQQADSHPALCDTTVVAETCTGVNKLTTEYYDTAADADMEVVHAAELSEQLMTSRSSIREFLEGLGLKNLEDDSAALAKKAYAVDCAKLCEAVVQSIPLARRPPTSDVACYMPHGKTEAECDIDVSEATLGASIRPDSLETNNPADQVYGEGSKELARRANGSADVTKYKELLATQAATNPDDLAVLDALDYPDVAADGVRVAIANLFRIYPLNNIQVAAASTETSLLQTRANWQDQVQKNAVRAQAYTATATRSITTAKADAELVLWFGKSDVATKKEVRRILNQVNQLLSNVEYIYPGKQCTENRFAYVIPSPPHNMNKRGQYLINLCDKYVNADMSEQVETLTHEASHHRMALMDDVCYKGTGADCQVAYGRIACENLAERDPKAALGNADSFAYFVNDVQPHPRLPQCPLPEQRQCTGDPTCVCPAGLYQNEVKTTTGATCYACSKTKPRHTNKKKRSSADNLCKTTDTGGTCNIFLCSRTRGPTSCSGGKCYCQTGLCAEDGYCTPPRVNNMLGSSSKAGSSGQDCEVDTGGTCAFLFCWHGRGPTSCENGKCICRSGYCSQDGTCKPKYNS